MSEMKRRSSGSRLLTILVASVLLAAIASEGIAPSAAPAMAAMVTITGLSASAERVAQYDKLELTFQIVHSAATNTQFPYDPSPPPGLPARLGITVEGLFLPPDESDWGKALVQPGFLFQDYERRQIDGVEWLYPKGDPVWKVRFAPESRGHWRYRVRVQDASICAADASPCDFWVQGREGGFDVGEPRPGNHGFVRVSETDSRYFAFDDGAYFPGLGHNDSFDPKDLSYDADSKLATFGANGVDFVRTWLTGSDLVGSAWNPWVWFGGPGYGGYLQDPGLEPAPAGSGHDFTFNLSQESGRLCLMNGWSQGPIAVKPDRVYRVAITARVTGVDGPATPSQPYGLTLKTGPWPSSCPAGAAGYDALVEHVHDADWQTLTGTITTKPDQWFLDYLFLMLDNTTGGEADVSEISLREDLGNGRLGPELLAKSRGDVHHDFSQPRSWDWDHVLDQAAASGVYLKLVILEKNDRVWNSIRPDGSVISEPGPGDKNGNGAASASGGGNENFYVSANTKVHRLYEYYWRYLIARWGYSTAVHSWELLNEGDPYNGNHYALAESMARFFHRYEPSRHLVTTSFWHSYPVAEFWANPAYPNVDYSDVHAYVNTGFGAYEWDLPTGTSLETDRRNTYQGSPGAIRVEAGVTSDYRSTWVRGKGDWSVGVMIKTEGITGSCPYAMPSSLAGPQLEVAVDGVGTRAIPTDWLLPDRYWLCSSPAGTHDYARFQSTISVPDDDWHALHLKLKTDHATSGTAWFDNLEITGPDGRKIRLFGDGSFDDRRRVDVDSALYDVAYSQVFDPKGVSGAGKPVVRGEAGITLAEPGDENPALAKDTSGVWLHNYLWATLNAGGLYELYWWTDNIDKNNLHFHYRHLHDFLDGVQLDNGLYRDAQAQSDNPKAAIVGQKDTFSGRAHLWIRNVDHIWQAKVDGGSWGAINSGVVRVSGFAAGRSYPVEWWEFDDAGRLAKRQAVTTADPSGSLVLNLSSLSADTTDVGVKIGDYDGQFVRRLEPVVK